MRLALAALGLALLAAAPAAAFPDAGDRHPHGWEPPTPEAQIVWRGSIARGTPAAGRLAHGVRLPAESAEAFTWDPVFDHVPNRGHRRFGTHRLVQIVLRVVREYATAHPDAARVGIGDLSRRRGGSFFPVHATHQNGRDFDVYFPRRDGRERPPTSVSQIDRRLAQDLVDRFVAAGATLVYVGPSTGFTGPRRVVRVRWNHDDHLHVRIGAKTR